MLQPNASRFLLPIIRNVVPKRNRNVVSGPPTKHVPKGELYALGSLIAVSVLATPAWVLYHIKDYRGK